MITLNKTTKATVLEVLTTVITRELHKTESFISTFDSGLCNDYVAVSKFLAVVLDYDNTESNFLKMVEVFEQSDTAVREKIIMAFEKNTDIMHIIHEIQEESDRQYAEWEKKYVG